MVTNSTTEPDIRSRPAGDRRVARSLKPRAALRVGSEARPRPIDVRGKIAVITGASSGIGFEASRQLAVAGARVVLACRHPGRMAEASRAIRMECANAVVDEVTIDLGSLRSVTAAANLIADRYTHIDLLINNAGVIAAPGWRTLDGFETCFGVNHLAHFALTGLLLDRLLAAPDARVVTVSSTAHRFARLHPRDWPHPENAGLYQAYADSKLANLLFAYQLHRNSIGAGVAMRSMACHPGWAASQLLAPRARNTQHRASVAGLRAVGAIVAQPARAGASSLLYASGADIPSGTYLGPSRWGKTRGPVKSQKSSDDSQNADAARLLWDLSVELAGVEYRFPTRKPDDLSPGDGSSKRRADGSGGTSS